MKCHSCLLSLGRLIVVCIEGSVCVCGVCVCVCVRERERERENLTYSK